jgi:alpha-galactosidase
MMTRFVTGLVLTLFVIGCKPDALRIEHGDLVIEFDELLHSRVSSKHVGATPLMNNFHPSEYLVSEDAVIKDFRKIAATHSTFRDSLGPGRQWLISGIFEAGIYKIEKQITITLRDTFNNQAFYKVTYINRSPRDLEVARWVNHHYAILPHADSIPYWSFQGESTGARRDWVLPVKPGFYQRNFMGMNNTDYGGGIPVTDLWRPDAGIAIGHAEIIPQLVSLPVEMNRFDNKANIKIQFDFPARTFLNAGDSLQTIETFVSVHQGDYFQTLKQYGEMLRCKGLEFAKPVDAAFEPSWCAWGYMREFTIDEILGTIPKVKSLGIKWVTIDDGYQQAEGDWHVNTKKFPRGDAQMKALVDKLHEAGLKVMLWWAPLAADPNSKLLESNPVMKSLTADGAPHYITWWDAYYLSPSFEKTRQHTREMLDLFFNQWGVDGLKMDGQHLNAVPADHHPGHGLAHPEQSSEDLPQFFKMVYEQANQMKTDVVMQLCPCGTCMSVFNLPYMNQAVASDPLSSWQIRLKGKTYKALKPDGAYFGDHVELSDKRDDFASSFGIGAVLGTKFTWPKENPFVKEDNLLTPAKEGIWRKWFSLYKEKMLSKESYLGGLYDIGYDIPETHVIAKRDTLHYAFYNNSWNGPVKLKGLTKLKYQVRDYVNDIVLGEVTKEKPTMNFKFEGSLLVEVYPIE